MKSSNLATLNTDYILRPPQNDDEWAAYHAIRRAVLFENRGQIGVYVENHPDESKPNNYPLVLVHSGVIIGVIRVDIDQRVAWFRRVAIRHDMQSSGHGRWLLRLAEAFAREKDCVEIRSNVDRDAIGFYVRCGYAADTSTTDQRGSASMRKELR